MTSSSPSAKATVWELRELVTYWEDRINLVQLSPQAADLNGETVVGGVAL